MGLASANETAEVTQWANQYPEVAAEIEAIQAGLEGYSQTHAIAPDPSVKEKIFNSINSAKTNTVAPVIDMNINNGATVVRSIAPTWRYVAAASIVLLLVSSFLNYNFVVTVL